MNVMWPTPSIGAKVARRHEAHSASVSWPDVPVWNVVDQKHQTPNLSLIVREIVNRNGWNSGNAIALIITGSGKRTAESYDGEPANAPRLFIEYKELGR